MYLDQAGFEAGYYWVNTCTVQKLGWQISHAIQFTENRDEMEHWVPSPWHADTKDPKVAQTQKFVRGIGEALAQADKALTGDISAMTNSLGVAFNSTLVALLISIVLMFLLHQLQRLQDGLVVDTQQYCESFFLNRISKLDDA